MTKAKTRDQQLLDSRQECDSLKTLLQRANETASSARNEMAAAKEEAVETRKEFNDLKTRIFDSEIENSRLRGYIQRVQEDDVVREPLIATGDPEGEQVLTPKRQSVSFNPPVQMTDFADAPSHAGYYHDRPKPKMRHWITYGTRRFPLILIAVLAAALFSPSAFATDCPAGAKSCKVLTITPEEEEALTGSGRILDTALQGRFIDLNGAVKYFRDKITNAPAGVVKEEKPSGAK